MTSRRLDDEPLMRVPEGMPARQIERYGIPEVYAFSTDFPHPEGGTDPIGRMAADIEPLGADAVEAFFIGNAELLLPS